MTHIIDSSIKRVLMIDDTSILFRIIKWLEENPEEELIVPSDVIVSFTNQREYNRGTFYEQIFKRSVRMFGAKNLIINRSDKNWTYYHIDPAHFPDVTTLYLFTSLCDQGIIKIFSDHNVQIHTLYEANNFLDVSHVHDAKKYYLSVQEQISKLEIYDINEWLNDLTLKKISMDIKTTKKYDNNLTNETRLNQIETKTNKISFLDNNKIKKFLIVVFIYIIISFLAQKFLI